MMTNAQLDNEKQLLRYEVDLFKERLDDAEEQYIELGRQHANLRRVITLR
jgi:LRRFIP family